MARPLSSEELDLLNANSQNGNSRGVVSHAQNEPELVQASRNKTNAVQAAYAQNIPDVTKSQGHNLEVPVLRGPTETMSFKLPGPKEAIWNKVQHFVQNLENSDVVGTLDSYKLQAYYYLLPRFCLYRIQLFRDEKDDETPFTVEMQRRDGDAYLTNIVFQQLKQEFVKPAADEFGDDQEASKPTGYVHMISWTPDSDGGPDFTYLDLSECEEDVTHWCTLLNQANLESARSGSGCLALAAQTEQNFQYIMSNSEAILSGVNNLFAVAEDPPTVFSCAVLLASLAVNSDWCRICLENDMLASILRALIRWSGSGNSNKLVSKQVLLHFSIVLRRMRDAVGDESFVEYLGNDELSDSMETIAELLKNEDPRLASCSAELNSVLFE